jgi:hypothetical protein
LGAFLPLPGLGKPHGQSVSFFQNTSVFVRFKKQKNGGVFWPFSGRFDWVQIQPFPQIFRG